MRVKPVLHQADCAGQPEVDGELDCTGADNTSNGRKVSETSVRATPAISVSVMMLASDVALIIAIISLS